MKAAWIALTLAVLAISAPMDRAFANETESGSQLSAQQIESLLTVVVPFDLINWKVGDTSSFNISAGPFGKVGNMVKTVTKDEGTAIWLKQQAKLQNQNEVYEMLINKADAKVLKLIHNGKEEAVPNDKIEIISQDTAEVRVPAGTFQTIHIVAKSEKASKIEVWANPRDTVMEGTVKQLVNNGMFDIIMELTSFKRN